MSQTHLQQAREAGFTLVELLVVIVIVTVLFVLSTVNLGKAQTTASVTATINTLLADIKSQQLLSMTGEQGSTSNAQPHGIYIQPNTYTLFADTTFSNGDPNNFSVSVGSNTLSTTFPSNQLIFETGDGAVMGFVTSDNTITVSGNGTSQTITVNRFGATAVH